jgi:hypothetical protein
MQINRQPPKGALMLLQRILFILLTLQTLSAVAQAQVRGSSTNTLDFSRPYADGGRVPRYSDRNNRYIDNYSGPSSRYGGSSYGDYDNRYRDPRAMQSQDVGAANEQARQEAIRILQNANDRTPKPEFARMIKKLSVASFKRGSKYECVSSPNPTLKGSKGAWAYADLGGSTIWYCMAMDAETLIHETGHLIGHYDCVADRLVILAVYESERRVTSGAYDSVCASNVKLQTSLGGNSRGASQYGQNGQSAYGSQRGPADQDFVAWQQSRKGRH